MKQFIKFTNPKVFTTEDHVRSITYEEFIVDIDTIESVVSFNGNRCVVLLLAVLHTEGHTTITRRKRIDLFISKEDYDRLAAILTYSTTAKITITEQEPEITIVPCAEEEGEEEAEVVGNLNIEEALKNNIIKALEKNGGNRKCAAADLGICERTLYRKMKEFGL